MQLLNLKSISYTYPNRDAYVLKQVNLEVKQGEVLGLLGNNGSGKSTLLQIAAGLITPQSGEVILCDILCASEKEFREARKDLGYLLQDSDDMLFCPSILEDVAFGPYNTGKSSKEAETIAWDTLKKLGIDRLASFNGNCLSGGEKKMVALACILAMKPKLLFLDEPTNNLDPESREKLIEVLSQLGLPSLVISHDIEFMQRFCTRFCILEHGLVSDVENIQQQKQSDY